VQSQEAVTLRSQRSGIIENLHVVIGQEAAVIIATGRQTAAAVPATAVFSRNGQMGVLVVDDGLVNFRPVSLGVQNGK
jgi:hypothetical protein